MIDTDHLVYAGVLLLFLAGAASLALTALLFLSTGLLTGALIRIIRRGTLKTVLATRARRGLTVDVPLPMDEALRQVAAGKAAPAEDCHGTKPRTAATPVKEASRRYRPQQRHHGRGRAKTAA